MAKDYPKSGVYWSKNWSEAWGEAWNRNVPIFIAVHKDGSEDCAAMAAVFREKRFIEASRMWVSLMVHPGTAHDVDVEIDGKKVPRCELYFDITCKDHADAEAQLSKMLKNPAELPTRIFLNPKINNIVDREIGREKGAVRLSELLKSMDKIQAQMPGPKLSVDDWRKGLALVAEGDAAFSRKEWQKAIKAYPSAMKLGEALKAHGQGGLSKVNLQGEFLYAKAHDSQPKELKGDYTETKRILRKIIGDFKSLPIEQKAREYLSGLEFHGH